MCQLAAVPLVAFILSVSVAAPVPQEPDAKSLVAGLSDPDEKVRDASSAALKGRADALPWLRRANRSNDEGTARQADALIAPHRARRQAAVPKALDVCVRDGRVDLFTEWHQWWEPRLEEELWSVGPRITKAGLDLYAKSCPPADWAAFDKRLTRMAAMPSAAHNGPPPARYPLLVDGGAWLIRTDRMDRSPDDEPIRFASIGGPVALSSVRGGGLLLALGSLQTSNFHFAFVACDGDVWQQIVEVEVARPTDISAIRSVVVCRGSFTRAGDLFSSVLLADGDIDLTHATHIQSCLIRAGGEVHLRKDVKIINSTIEGRANRPTAPYTFFELAEVGLSVADDEEGLVVREVKVDTPFGTCGLAKGDLIRAIDDAPAGHSEQFRKKVRRALVRQGDCLLTVTRGDKTLDLPVFFPPPK
jgi:hypothetical protein